MTLSNYELMSHYINGTLSENMKMPINYPPPIMITMGMQLIEITPAPTTIVEMDPTLAQFANPLGTMHGGVHCTLADTAIGIAHWISLKEGESFTSVDLRINYFRPLFDGKIRAAAHAINYGKTLSYYTCGITRLADNKLIASVTSTVITLRGISAAGR